MKIIYIIHLFPKEKFSLFGNSNIHGYWKDTWKYCMGRREPMLTAQPSTTHELTPAFSSWNPLVVLWHTSCDCKILHCHCFRVLMQTFHTKIHTFIFTRVKDLHQNIEVKAKGNPCPYSWIYQYLAHMTTKLSVQMIRFSTLLQ